MSVDTLERPAENATMSGVVPFAMIDGAAAAAEFYKKAFGAIEVMSMPSEDGKKLMHCHLRINGGAFCFNDCFPEYGQPDTGHAGYTLHLQVDDVDAWWKRALDAGCEVAMPLELQFWGDRYGQVKDPFGITWSLGQTQ